MINTIDFTICDEEGFTKHEHTTIFFHDIAYQMLRAMALRWTSDKATNGSTYMYLYAQLSAIAKMTILSCQLSAW